MRSILPVLLAAACCSSAFADDPKADKPAAPPDATGKWAGTWGPYDAQKGTGPAKPHSPSEMVMECNVVRSDGGWQATFEGECGRPYKYTIKMDGRAVNGAVLFKGTTDLGEKDGGVYDWIGRADDKEFIGFYTSAKYTGVFRLTRVQ